MVRRNYPDICADIQLTAMGGAKKTRIVHQANLNFKNNDTNTLICLLKNGLLLSTEDRIFVITMKRVRFL